MNDRVDKIKENKRREGPSDLSGRQTGEKVVSDIPDKRAEYPAQEELVDLTNHSEHVNQLKAIQEIANKSPQVKPVQLKAMSASYSVQKQNDRMESSGSTVVQRAPKKKADSEEYHDPDYPKLRLIKTNRPGAGNEYQIIGSGTLIYYEPGVGWFTDYNCTNRADMSAYMGAPEEREGIANNGGSSYFYYTATHTGGFMSIMNAYKLLQALNTRLGQNDADLNKGKVSGIVQEMKDSRPIHPIELRNVEHGFVLVNGRHRIIASMITGKKTIPYNIIG
jgi:hypothetical protein